MANVPVVDGFSVHNNPTPTPYQHINTNDSMFNATLGMGMVAKGLGDVSKASASVKAEKDKYDKEQAGIKAINAAADYDNYAIKTLYDKDNGLFAKKGKAYLDNMNSTLSDLNLKKEEFLKNLSPLEQSVVNKTLTNKYNTFNERITKQSLEEDKTYKQDSINNFINTQKTMALENMNTPEAVDMNLTNIRNIIDFSYRDKLGENEIKLMQDKETSKILEEILETKIGAKSSDSKEFFEKYKSQIDPANYSKHHTSLNNLTINIESSEIAQQYYASGMSEADAYNKALKLDKKHNTDVYSAKVSTLYSKQRGIEKRAYSDAKDNFWNTFAENPDIDNIPAFLKTEDRIKAMKYAKNDGGINNAQTYEELFQMKASNAEEFGNIDLNDYRDNLTKGDYRKLFEAQQKIRNHEYSSFTPDDERVVAVAGAIGYWGNDKNRKEAVSSYTQKLVQAEEARLGRKLTAKEQNKYFEYIGYKDSDGKTFDIIKNNSTKADFYKKTVSDCENFKSTHKRMPNNDEFQEILIQNVAQAKIKHNEQIYKQAQENTNTPKVERVVVVDKTGKRFSLPVSQLKEAEKRGYKKI